MSQSFSVSSFPFFLSFHSLTLYNLTTYFISFLHSPYFFLLCFLICFPSLSFIHHPYRALPFFILSQFPPFLSFISLLIHLFLFFLHPPYSLAPITSQRKRNLGGAQLEPTYSPFPSLPFLSLENLTAYHVPSFKSLAPTVLYTTESYTVSGVLAFPPLLLYTYNSS